MDKFKGKNVFLVAPVFYNYEEEVKNVLQYYGLNVTSFFFIGYPPKKLSFKNDEKTYLKKIKNEIYLIIQNKVFDYLLVINNSLLDYNLLEILLNNNKSIQKIIYLWDSYKNLNWDDFENYLSYFDFRFSFDFRDCMRFSNLNLKHRPNFYHPAIDNINTNKEPIYDISSVMSAQPERIRIINELEIRYPDLIKAFHIHLLRFKSIPAYLINHKVIVKPKYIKLNQINISNSIKLFNNSKSILDIPSNNQFGLPFRTLDAIGLRKKLITTNKDVVNYDFYDPDNVLTIQSGEVDKVKDFLSVPYKPLNESVRKKYSLKFWIKTVLNNENINYT